MNKGTVLEISVDAMGPLARFFRGGREIFPSDGPEVAAGFEKAVRFDEAGEPVVLMSALPLYSKQSLARIRQIRGAKLRSNVLSRR